MTRGRARRYLLMQSDDSYYPQVVADAGYSVWDWDASRLSTLYQDSAKTTPVTANSDPVGAWVDGVGGVDAVQATTANKPTYTTASLNGLPTLGFDGGDLLVTGNISISTFAVWVVFKATAGGAFFEHYQSATDFISNRSTITYVRDSLAVSSYTMSAQIDDVPRIYRYEFNDTNASHKLAINGEIQSLTPNDTGDPVYNASGPLSIGSRNGGGGYITCNMAHLCIVSPYPTDASIIANMESYINNLWNGVY